VVSVVVDGQRRADRPPRKKTSASKHLLKEGTLIARHGLHERGMWSSIEYSLDKNLPRSSRLDGGCPGVGSLYG